MSFAVNVKGGTGAGVKRPKDAAKCRCGGVLALNRTTGERSCVRGCDAT